MTEPLFLLSPADVSAERAEAEAQRHGDSIDPHTQGRNAPVVLLVGAYARLLCRREAGAE
jgi:hypothetical protein